MFFLLIYAKRYSNGSKSSVILFVLVILAILFLVYRKAWKKRKMEKEKAKREEALRARSRAELRAAAEKRQAKAEHRTEMPSRRTEMPNRRTGPSEELQKRINEAIQQGIEKSEKKWEEQQKRKEELELLWAAAEEDFSLLDNMEGHEFEYWCANLLKQIGFSEVQVTPGSGDQGVDIIAAKDGEKYAIQCKRYGKPLGNKSIQEVYTGRTIYGCDKAAIMTNQFFTSGAISAANAVGVLLWDREELARMIRKKNQV